jgi:signal transduction histidine kinase
VRALSLFLLAGLLTALALYVWRAKPENSVNIWFGLFTLSLDCWVLGIACVEAGFHTEFFGRLSFVGGGFVPPTFLAFSRVFPTPSAWPTRWLVAVAVAGAAVLAVLSTTTPLVAHSIRVTAVGIKRSAGPLYPLFVVYFVCCSITSISAFIAKARQARGLAKAQLQYLGIGVLVMAIGGSTSNLLIPFLTDRSSSSSFGPYFVLPLVLLIGHAIIRHRLMDLRLVINRGITYLVASAVLSAVVIVMTRILLFPGRMVPEPRDALVVAIVSLLMLSVPGQRIVERLVDPYLYRRRLDYQSALRDAAHRLSRLMQPGELASELRSFLSAAFMPEAFVMIVRTAEGQRFEVLGATMSVDDKLRALVTTLVDDNAPSVFFVGAPRSPHDPPAVHEALRRAGIELIITLGRRSQPFGAMLLGPRKSGDAYFAPDLTFIESLAELASIALENSLLYKQRIQMLEYSDRLLEALDSAVVAVDVEGRIISFNSASKALLGLADDDRERRAHLTVLPSQVAWALALALTDAWRPAEVEASIDHSARGSVPVILSTAVLHDEPQRVSGALVVVTDLSTVKALEHNQRRVEHLAMMARFYAGIAHEIRNPLTAISNFISMLPDRFDDAEYRETAARLLPHEVDRIVGLADRLKLMAPSEGGKLVEIALPPLLADIIALHGPAAAEVGCKLLLTCSVDPPKIAGDPGQLVQLFVNLFKNATESMPRGGDISVEVSYAKSLTGEDGVVVRVVDGGIGIDPSFRGRIFEPFFTTKPSGTGLGLSICQEIADFHRARLTLSPRFDHNGTVAQIEFPSLGAETVSHVRDSSRPSHNKA